GQSAYLVKPIAEDRLRSTVARLVQPHVTILAIDDDPDVLEILRQLFNDRKSYQLVTAAGGQAGLDSIRQQPPDLILLDLTMPEVDGFAVLAELDKHPATRAIPVIVLTAKELTSSEHEYLTRRVTQYLKKDATDSMHLLHQINTVLHIVDTAN
ncbi:MAG: response regulator, partial [Chloroflexaceae bacterium]|nr:response regulator [Chloroflexaceae bacterium]